VLFDFIVEELANLEPKDSRRIRPVRIALQSQRDCQRSHELTRVCSFELTP
jgi:hypothetical protein